MDGWLECLSRLPCPRSGPAGERGVGALFLESCLPWTPSWPPPWGCVQERQVVTGAAWGRGRGAFLLSRFLGGIRDRGAMGPTRVRPRRGREPGSLAEELQWARPGRPGRPAHTTGCPERL